MKVIGTLCRLRWPYTNLHDGKNRPALILSEPDVRGDIEVAMITGSDAHARSIPIKALDFLEGSLPKTSWVRTDRILKVRLAVVERLAARVSVDFVSKVRKAVIASDVREYSRLSHTANRPGNDPLRLAAEGVADRTSKIEDSISQDQISNLPSPGTRSVPYAGRVFTEDEVEAAVSATLDFWLTLGPEGEAFEKELAAFLGVKHSLLVNSGSSANLIALSCLTTHKLPDHKRIRPGDEVITCAAGFPTTVAPIIQNGCIPVFIDNDPTTGNARVDQLESAYSPEKTKAVMMAHTLGNPFDLGAVLAFCKKYDLWLIEDNCDALGCTYSLPLSQAKSLGLEHLIKQAEANSPSLLVPRLSQQPTTPNEQRTTNNQQPLNSSSHQLPFLKDGLLTAYTGSFGDLSTQSFYPPHHLTMGEGGAVNIIRRASLKTYAESFRDWGRDCWCPSGKDNTCNKRFGWQIGELPAGYDHKYIYSHMGYNLKPLDPQAAIGRVQLRRLPDFIETRKQNWETLRRGLADMEDDFDFSLPTHATAWLPPAELKGGKAEKLKQSESPINVEPRTKNQEPLVSSTFLWPPPQPLNPSSPQPGSRCDPSWFGFMIRVKPSAPFTVRELAAHLDEKKIGNRMLFGGNLLRQPAFVQLKKDNPNAFRVVGMANSEGIIANPQSEPSPFAIRHSLSAEGTPSSAIIPPPLDIPSALPGADEIMHTAIFLGTYPGLTPGQIDYEIATIKDFVRQKSGVLP